MMGITILIFNRTVLIIPGLKIFLNISKGFSSLILDFTGMKNFWNVIYLNLGYINILLETYKGVLTRLTSASTPSAKEIF